MSRGRSHEPPRWAPGSLGGAGGWHGPSDRQPGPVVLQWPLLCLITAGPLLSVSSDEATRPESHEQHPAASAKGGRWTSPVRQCRAQRASTAAPAPARCSDGGQEGARWCLSPQTGTAQHVGSVDRFLPFLVAWKYAVLLLGGAAVLQVPARRLSLPTWPLSTSRSRRNPGYPI